MPNGDETTVIPKREESREENVSSLESAHDDDQQLDLREGAGSSNAPEGSPVQKRKGGRKPLYQTTEEKKQRNRRAQAAFRERRTEHIKQLETDKKLLEDRVESMEAGQRKDKDENLMLRYKNSLLERILVEHNIDFKAEIRQQGLSYSPASVPRTAPQVPVRRSVLQRPKPSPLSLNTKTPMGLHRSNSAATAGPTSAPPVAPSNVPFNFRSPVAMQPVMSGAIPGVQSPFLGNPRSQTQMAGGSNSPISMRRASMHSQWPSGFVPDIQQSQRPFPMDAESFQMPSVSPVLQTHFQEPGNASQQFSVMSQNQFPASGESIGQVLEAANSMPPTLTHQVSHNTPVLDQAYGMMVEDLSAYEALQEDSDPLGIDKSMQYPTQLDYVGGQRKQ